MEPVLLIDIGSTYTKVAAVDIKGQCIIGAAQSFTTVETDITEGLLMRSVCSGRSPERISTAKNTPAAVRRAVLK